MTQHKDVYLECDGCSVAFGQQRWYGTAKMARAKAADEGWVNHGADDYCPECGNT